MDILFEIAWLLALYYTLSVTVFRLTVWQPENDWVLTSWFLTFYIPMFMVYYPFVVTRLLLSERESL